jgi:flagellar hook-basal body protein
MSIDVNSQVTSSITSLEQEFSAIAHNLANFNTVGYKRISTSFSKALEAQQSGAADSSEAELNLSLDLSQGLSFIQTGRSLDAALYGKGFFVVETPDGLLYTRNGSFKINQNGQIFRRTVRSAPTVRNLENSRLLISEKTKVRSCRPVTVVLQCPKMSSRQERRV